MKRLLNTITLLLGLAITASTATADTVTIYTGEKGKGYDAKAKVIAQRLAQRGFEVEVENRNGSDDITLQAFNDPNSIWISQIDALYTREMKEGCFLPVVADYGDEIAVLLFPPKSKADELSDLTASHTVFVDKVGSGSELFWRSIKAIEMEHGKGDSWTKAQSSIGDLRRAQALATRGKIHAVLLVRKQNSGDLQKLLSTGWTIGEPYDKDINDLTYGAKPLYESKKVKLQWGETYGKGYVYTVRSFIGTTEAIEADQPKIFDALLGALE